MLVYFHSLLSFLYGQIESGPGFDMLSNRIQIRPFRTIYRSASDLIFIPRKRTGKVLIFKNICWAYYFFSISIERNRCLQPFYKAFWICQCLDPKLWLFLDFLWLRSADGNCPGRRLGLLSRLKLEISYGLYSALIFVFF